MPYDPDIYFSWEETTMAVRAFTHGYDLFHPSTVVTWHEYSPDYRIGTGTTTPGTMTTTVLA